jgi:hypothetical protein
MAVAAVYDRRNKVAACRLRGFTAARLLGII